MTRLILCLFSLIGVAVVYFLTTAGRLPQSGEEWVGVSLGAAYMLTLAGVLGWIRAAARTRLL